MSAKLPAWRSHAGAGHSDISTSEPRCFSTIDHFPGILIISWQPIEFVILSHWDFDHFALAIRYPQLKGLNWFAPKQPVGPNTAHFQKTLGKRLNSSQGMSTLVGFCSSDALAHRRATGIQLAMPCRIDREDAGILLPGDADYQWIPPVIARGANQLMMPHHGAAGSPPPSPNGKASPVAVASYGVPNTYRHPNED